MSKSSEFIITPDTIIREICRYFRLEEDQIKGQSRSRDSLNARQIAMYLIRRMTSLSLDDNGKVFGGRDHSTVINSINKVERKCMAAPAPKPGQMTLWTMQSIAHGADYVSYFRDRKSVV